MRFGDAASFKPPPRWANKLGYVWLRIPLPAPGQAASSVLNEEPSLLFDHAAYEADMGYLRHPADHEGKTLIQICDGMPSNQMEPQLVPLSVEELCRDD